MQGKKRRVKRNVLVLAFAVTAFFFLLFRLDVFRRVENITYDWRMKILRDKEPTGDIVLVFIGDDTLSSLGEWPLSRQWYAGLTEILKNMGARAVVFDILFIDSRDADAEFARAMEYAGNVVLPFYFDSPESKDGVLQSEMMAEPVKELKEHALSSGFINILPDTDGVIRKYPLFIKHNDKTYNSLCAAILEDVMGASITSEDRSACEFEINGEKKTVPLGDNYSAYLNIYPDLKKFPNYSFVQVFQSYVELSKGGAPIIPGDSFEDKIVIVGSTATGAADKGVVSGAANYPLMGVHASFLENFLKGEFIKRAGPAENFLVPLAFALTAGLVAATFSPLAGILFVIILAGVFVALAFSLFTFRFFWIDILPGVLSIFFVYGIRILAGFISEREERMKVKGLFSRYISPAVMDKLLGSGEDVLLVGEQKILTVLFADVRGFTSYADVHSPEETVAFLNRILSILSEAVFKFGGTLDKFIGDEVMAIYGAPVDDPLHAVNAVLCAQEMMRNMKIFKGEVKIGVGINTGEMIIGNIGTARRMDYTAIGDAVNVAARIEGLTAGGEILVGEETYKMISKENIPCEKAGTFNVQGKGAGLVLYRVLWK